MKFISSGDHHWDFSRRWDECVRIHAFIVELVGRVLPDLFISTGDVYERASTPEERIAAAQFFIDIARFCPVLIIRGNHDTRRDLELLGKLESVHPIIVEERAAVHYIGGAAIAAVAWPERAQLLAYVREHFDEGVSPDMVAQEALQHVLRGLGAELAAYDNGPRIGAGHFMVDGSVTSVGQPLIGMPMNVALSDLGLLNAHFVVMGHIHKPQDWLHDTTPIAYTGSPVRTSYGEVEDKSVVMAEFDDAGLVKWERLQMPCAGMFLVSECWANADDGFGAGPEMHFDQTQVPGADIRMRYTVDLDQREAARREAQLWRDDWIAAGAHDVKLEEDVNTTTRARAPEVAAALTLGDKLLALWKSRDTTPASPRKEHLIDLAQSLESEEQAS